MRSRWLGPVLAGVLLVAALAVYAKLPAELPTHWNASGEVDGWMSKSIAAFLPAALTLGIWALLAVLPRFDPRREHYERFWPTYWLIANVVLLFLALVTGASLAVGLGWRVDVTRLAVLGTGVLFIALGNVMPRLRSNWWMGVRTPWTLSSDRVWRETHRVAGVAFVLAGLVTLASVALPAEVSVWVMIATIVVASLIPAIYSYVAWRRERNAAQ